MTMNLETYIIVFIIIANLASSNPSPKHKSPKKKQQCQDKEGTIYQEGDSYSEGCVTYTCTKLGKKMMTLVPSVIGKCCEVEGKGLYKVGETIHLSDDTKGSCSKKTVKCGKPQIVTTVDHSGCCVYKGDYFNVGDKIPVPNKCAWLTCSMMLIPNKESLASLDLISEYNDCDCCLVSNEMMIQDGVRYANSNGAEVLCYKGNLISMNMIDKHWMGDYSHQMQDHDMSITDDKTVTIDNLTMIWDSTEQVLQIKEEKRDYLMEIKYFSKMGVRVVKQQQNCFMSKYTQENIDPKQYENALKNPQMLNLHRFYISISTKSDSEITQGLEECPDFRKNLIDLEVSEDLFQKASNGSLVSLSSKINKEDSCEILEPVNIETTLMWNDFNPRQGSGVMSSYAILDGSLGDSTLLLPFTFLHQCSGVIDKIKREYCEGNNNSSSVTMFFELKGKIIIQERDC